MATLTDTIEMNVPIEFANREWTEFVFLSLFRNYAAKPSDVAWSIDESDADAGIVTFDTQGDTLVKVTVELQYTPQSGNDPDAEVRQVQDRLRRDLERYRAFVLRRCEEASCRDS